MSAPKVKKDKIYYTNKSGFTLCQHNGQRTYGGPPPNWGSRPPPSRDCEVFIGRLPRMCFEDELIPLFLTAGELYEFRLMLDFSGTNRGYGYAHYATLAGAQRAIEKLNKYEIRPGHQIGVLKSKNNCRLLFGNIKSAMDIEAFDEFIRAATDQVLNVLMFKSFQQLKQTDFRISSDVEEAFLARVPRNNGSNQFAIVEYENHKAAAVARRILIPKYGHILAIDWAVPPKDKKPLITGVDVNLPPIERPLPNPPLKETNLIPITKQLSKLRPVPVLLVQPSALERIPYMPKNLKSLVKLFKYQLSISLYKSVDQFEIPLFICKEIDRKIVDRVTNLESCSQAVLLILNYSCWYNEKRRFVNSEAQRLLQEVKLYADSFIQFISRKLNLETPLNEAEDNYYTHWLPFQLNILFRIILLSGGEYRMKLSSGITNGLTWLLDNMQKGDKVFKDLIEGIANQLGDDNEEAFDKSISLAKSVFLNEVTSRQIQMVLEFRKNQQKYGIMPSTEIDKQEAFKNVILNQKFLPEDQNFKVEENRQQMNSAVEKNDETANENFPPVPLLTVKSSHPNGTPFVPEFFGGVIAFFKHLTKVCLSVSSWQMSIPRNICDEIELKIIGRMFNIENCSEGVQLIINYLSWWIEKRPCSINMDIQKVLHEVKIYADSFNSFLLARKSDAYLPNETAENYFCEILPHRLSLLFQMMLIFDEESPMRFFIGISKGLKWLEEFIQKGDKTGKEFLEELTRYMMDWDRDTWKRAKNIGKRYCMEMVTTCGQPINQYAVMYVLTADLKTDGSNGSSIGTPNGLSLSGSDDASVSTLDYNS